MAVGTTTTMGIKQFLHDRRGNVAMIFAFAAIPVAGMVGGAVDLQMGVAERNRMQDALDAATLEVMAMSSGGTRAERAARLQRSYTANGGRGTVRIARDVTTTAEEMTFDTEAVQDMPTTVLGVIGVSTLNIGVESGARRRPELQTLRFRYRYMTGAYDKRISLFGVRPGSTTPVELMNIQYTWPRVTGGTTTTVRRLVSGRMSDVLRVTCPSHTTNIGCTSRILSGDGTAEANVEGYTHLYLQMTVSAANSVAAQYLWANLPRTIRSDDPNLSYRLFLEGRQVEPGRTVNIFTAMPCGRWSTQDWEDGGNGSDDNILLLNNTDVHYDVQGACAFSSLPGGVSLTR